MRVALDVDGVLADFTGATLAWIRSQLGIHLTYDEVVRYDIDSYIPEEKRHFLYDAWNAEHFCALIPPVDGVHEELKRWPKHVYRCLTSPMSSSLHWKRERSAWLKNLFGFAYEDVIYAHAKHEHHEEFDILIDDKIENVREWIKVTGKPAVVITQPWNRAAQDLPFRANNLKEALTIVETLRQTK